jgi:hypothetical protein
LLQELIKSGIDLIGLAASTAMTKLSEVIVVTGAKSFAGSNGSS